MPQRRFLCAPAPLSSGIKPSGAHSSSPSSLFIFEQAQSLTPPTKLIDSKYPPCIDNRIPKELKDLEKAEGLAEQKTIKGIILF